MIYLDRSVVLAEVFTEERRPTDEFWIQSFVSSRLLQYECTNRLHARRSVASRQARASLILRRVQFTEMSADALMRALSPLPHLPRTLDSLHLATLDHVRSFGVDVILASYDLRLLAAADAMGFPTLQP